MLSLASLVIDYPILSLHLGAEIGRTEEAIIDPAKLRVVGFWVRVEGEKKSRGGGKILETGAIRELARSGMIVDSEEVFLDEEDAVRLKEVLDLQFSLEGLAVETKNRTRLGKVTDYVIETETFKILQIIVRRPMLKAVVDPELVIPRSEIVEVADTKIIVRDEEEKIRKKAAREAFTPNFVNPFRESGVAARREEGE